MSNRCEGLPTGACPDNRCDKTVKFTIYDLFLCQSCERTRDAENASGISSEPKEVSNKKTSKQQSKKPAVAKAVGSSGSIPASDVAASQTMSSESTSSSGRSRQTPSESRFFADKTVTGDIENSDTAVIIGLSSGVSVNELLS